LSAPMVKNYSIIYRKLFYEFEMFNIYDSIWSCKKELRLIILFSTVLSVLRPSPDWSIRYINKNIMNLFVIIDEWDFNASSLIFEREKREKNMKNSGRRAMRRFSRLLREERASYHESGQ
jgi:hypothetical protein